MSATYALTANPHTVCRVADNAFIPDDPANRDYQEYLTWCETGNTPDPYVPPPTPEPEPLTLEAHPEGPMDAATKSSVEAAVVMAVQPLLVRLDALERKVGL
jgi:hypothetical protein